MIYQKSDKARSIIYTDLQSLIKTIDECKNRLEKSCKTKVVGHSPCGYSVSTILTIDGMENKHDVHKSDGCIKKIWKSL